MKSLFILLLILPFNNFAQQPWEKINGPYGGSIEGFASKQNGELYAVNNTKLYKSANNGSDWFQLTDGVSNINTVEITPSGRIYLGTDYRGVWWSDNDGITWNNNQITINTHTGLGTSVYNINLNPSGHIFISRFRSLNGGISWSELSISSNDYLFLSSNEILAATFNQGVYKSIDNGSSWSPLNNGMGNIRVNCIESAPGLLLAGTESNGVYVSNNNGQSWSQSISGLSNLNVLEIGVDNSSRIFASTPDGIFISVKNAASWQKLNLGVEPYWINDFDIVNGTELFASTQKTGILHSNDNGMSWNNVSNGITILGINDLVTNDATEIFLIAGGTLYFSSDYGDSWESKGSGLSQSSITSLAINNNGILFAGTINTGLFTSSDMGNTWTNISISGVDKVNNISVDNSNRITINSSDKLYHSSDAGLNWNLIFNSDTAFFLPQYLVVNDNGSIFYGGLTFFLDEVIFYSNDFGVSWSSVNFGNFNSDITSLYSDGETVYAGFNNSSIKYSPDDGETWLDYSSIPSGSVNAMTKTTNGIFLAAVSGGVFYTENNGITWNPLTAGFPSPSSPNFIKSDLNNMIYTGFYSEGFYRNDTWYEIVPVELASFTAKSSGNDVTLNWITSTETNNYGFEIEKSQRSIFQVGKNQNEWEKIGFVEGKGTTSKQQFYTFNDKNLSAGNYQYRLKQVDYDGSFEYSDMVYVDIEIPDQFFLSQNYPNPFNPTTNIKYEISTKLFISLKVFDILGNEVSDLVNEVKNPGFYLIEFDASGLASGTYFYRLEAGNFIETKKFVVLK